MTGCNGTNGTSTMAVTYYEHITNPKVVQTSCSDNIVLSQVLQRAGDTMQCVCIPSLFLIGMPTNILTMIIFYRQGLGDRMNLCLFCLAFSDLMYVTALLTMNASCIIGIFLPNQRQFWGRVLIKHSLNFVNGFSYSSGCLTMIIATERCMCVMFPMQIATFMKTKTMAVVVATAILFPQLVCGVYAIKENISIVQDVTTGRYLTFLTVTELYLSHSIFTIIENIVLPVISFSTVTVVFLATALTVVRLRLALKWRKSTGSSCLKGQVVLIKMLMVVSCIYILCAAPNVVLALTRFTVPEFRSDTRYCDIFFTTHLIGFLMVMLNSSVNFFVYVIMSSRFRRHLYAITTCKGSINAGQTKS